MAIAGWLIGAVVATAIGIAAVLLVAGDLSGPTARTLTGDEVADALDSATATSTPRPTTPQTTPTPTETPAEPTGSPTPSATKLPTPTGPAEPTERTAVLTSRAGSVLARCVDGEVTLDWWSPAPGYSVEDVERGPSKEVEVEFETDHDDDLEMKIICVDGVPTLKDHE